MQLQAAFDILHAKCADYGKYSEAVARALDIDPDARTLADYLEQIRDDPVSWFDAFPMEYASVGALAKPKTAILYLLEKVPDVKAEFGEDSCKALAARVEAEWKANKGRLVEERAALKEKRVPAPSSEVADVACCDVTDEADRLREELDVLKANMRSLKALFAKVMRLHGASDTELLLADEVLARF